MKIFMIVDDSPVIRKVVHRILDGMGHVVIEAEDGIEALEKSALRMPDVVIVDWDMPRMSGVDFILEFRSRDDCHQTKILFCTSGVMVTEMMKAKRAGCDGYVMKPFTRDVLRNALANIGLDEIAA